jgi:hypothetical protein
VGTGVFHGQFNLRFNAVDMHILLLVFKHN